MKPFSLAAAAVLAFIALGHLLRLVTGLEVRLGAYSVPLWMSAAAALALGALALLLLQEQRKS